MIVNEQMHMIVFSIEFHKGGFKILAYLGKNTMHVFKDGFSEDFTTVFGHEDQMNMHVVHTVPSVSDCA